MTQAPARPPARSPGSRPVPSFRRRVVVRQWPLALVLSGMLSSLVVVAVDDFRRGTLLFAGFVLLAAVLRLVLSTRRAGLLVLRGRPADVAVMTLLGLATAVLALVVPDIR